MELYFNVVSMEKGKCHFRFSYYKHGHTCIRGSVITELGPTSETAQFDKMSGLRLDTDEKKLIVSAVVKNLIH